MLAGLALLLARTRIGLLARAVNQDRMMVAATGIDLRRVDLIVFSLGTGIAGGFNGLTDFRTLLGFDLNAPGVGRWLYWLTLACLATGWAMVSLLLASRFGTMLSAVHDGKNRVRFRGHDAAAYRVFAFAIAGALAGAAGALFTLHAGVISPAMVGVVPSIEMVIWVAIGGRLSLAGAIVGTVAVNFARDKLSGTFPDLWLYALGTLFILVVTLLPTGLAGLRRRA